mgnify:CR=1 FL=1
MKNRKLLYSISSLFCAVFIITSPIAVNAEELTNEASVYYDTEEGRFVNNLDEYLLQLNNGMITPYAPTIEEYGPGISLYGTVSEPSKKCSNIFGHKWGDWGSWQEVNVVHRPNGPCILCMERTRFCERTHCGAKQIESDLLHVTNCHGDGN